MRAIPLAIISSTIAFLGAGPLPGQAPAGATPPPQPIAIAGVNRQPDELSRDEVESLLQGILAVMGDYFAGVAA